MVRSRAQAVAAAKRVTRYIPSGMCQQFTRVSFGIGGGFGSAAAAWRGAKKKHYVEDGNKIPAGVPVYWLGGSKGYGHAAVSLGGGLCRSTDWPRRYSVGTARINDITRQWGQNLVGWAEDINGTPIPGMPTNKPDTEPDVDLSNVIKATKAGTAIRRGKLLKGAVAKEVGKGKMNLASPTLGPHFRDQYVLVQRKYLKATGGKITAKSCDGIPGGNSLRWLAKRQDFDVIG